MDKEALKKNERDRGAKRRAEEKARRIVWRADLHRQQAETMERVKVLLNSSGISKTDWNYLYLVNKYRRPLPDQIKRINKLWIKYGFTEDKT